MDKKTKVILVVGLDSNSNMSVLGELAKLYGSHAVLVAGDTTPSAVLRTEILAKRVGTKVIKGQDRCDPASLVFDAVKSANTPYVICATPCKSKSLAEDLKRVVASVVRANGDVPDNMVVACHPGKGEVDRQIALFRDMFPGISVSDLTSELSKSHDVLES